MAPVALYPDQLLAQMLVCAATPARVTDLDKWLKTNPPFKGTALQDAAKQSKFEPSFVALVPFPQVVDFMATNLDWTTEVGQAFSSDRAGVLDSVQRLRADSLKTGKLKSTAQQNVSLKTTESGQQVIVIEPANPQVVYVPQYNTQTVYSQPPTSTTVVVQEEDDDAAEAMAAGLIGFTAGIAIGAAMDNDYYYGPYGWHGSPYMYNDAWDDWYDDREDAREDWYDNREDAREDYAGSSRRHGGLAQRAGVGCAAATRRPGVDGSAAADRAPAERPVVCGIDGADARAAAAAHPRVPAPRGRRPRRPRNRRAAAPRAIKRGGRIAIGRAPRPNGVAPQIDHLRLDAVLRQRRCRLHVLNRLPP